MSDEEGEEKDLDLTSFEVFTKYKSTAEIVNKALQLLLSECKTDAKIVSLWEKGDALIREQTGDLYKNVKKKIERGVALPTCISINNTDCHYSPLASDETYLTGGEILKIDMGCHIDGFIVVVAHTHVIQQEPITDRAAGVNSAANVIVEVALRLVRPGKKYPRQLGFTECEYFMLKFMKEVVKHGVRALENDNIGGDSNEYNDEDFNDIREEWNIYVSNFIFR